MTTPHVRRYKTKKPSAWKGGFQRSDVEQFYKPKPEVTAAVTAQAKASQPQLTNSSGAIEIDDSDDSDDETGGGAGSSFFGGFGSSYGGYGGYVPSASNPDWLAHRFPSYEAKLGPCTKLKALRDVRRWGSNSHEALRR